MTNQISKAREDTGTMSDEDWFAYQMNSGIVTIDRQGGLHLSLSKLAQCVEGRRRLQKLIEEFRI